jgi:hypothetical protein
MAWLGGLAIVVAVLGFAVAVVGLVMVIVGVRQDRRRTVGLRTVYSGTAVTCLGLTIFSLSRSSQTLAFPLNLVVALVFGTMFIRLAVAAIILKPPKP